VSSLSCPPTSLWVNSLIYFWVQIGLSPRLEVPKLSSLWSFVEFSTLVIASMKSQTILLKKPLTPKKKRIKYLGPDKLVLSEKIIHLDLKKKKYYSIITKVNHTLMRHMCLG
jgi:hypothetical protein